MDWYFRLLCRWNKFSEVRGGVTRAQRLWYIWEEAWQLIVSASLAFKTKWRPSETTHPSNHITLVEGYSIPSFSRPAKFLIRTTQTIQASAPKFTQQSLVIWTGIAQPLRSLGYQLDDPRNRGSIPGEEQAIFSSAKLRDRTLRHQPIFSLRA